MKNKICFCLLFTVLFLCGCTENTNITVSSENKVYETVSTEETVSLVTEKTTATTAKKTDPAAGHRPSTEEITCDFVQFCKDENEIYADDGALLAPVTVKYPQISTENKEVNEKINNAYIDFKDSVLQGNTPFFSTEKLFDNYYEYGITWNGIDCCSELKYYDEKYISFYNFNLNMAATAAHPIHAYTAHTFSFETGELLTIDDIFNNKFANFAEKYISNDLESINQRDDGHLFFGKSRDDITKKLKNNEWYLTPDGFTVIFAHSELTGYAFGTITSTIPWNIAEEYLK